MTDLKMTTTGDYLVDALIESHKRKQAEINALKAHVERLLKACQSAHGSYGKTLLSDPPQDAWKANQVTAKLVEAIAATPQQSLAEHDAEVAQKAYRAGFMASAEGYNGELYQDGYKVVVDGFNEDLKDYANKIKTGDL